MRIVMWLAGSIVFLFLVRMRREFLIPTVSDIRSLRLAPSSSASAITAAADIPGNRDLHCSYSHLQCDSCSSSRRGAAFNAGYCVLHFKANFRRWLCSAVGVLRCVGIATQLFLLASGKPRYIAIGLRPVRNVLWPQANSGHPRPGFPFPDLHILSVCPAHRGSSLGPEELFSSDSELRRSDTALMSSAIRCRCKRHRHFHGGRAVLFRCRSAHGVCDVLRACIIHSRFIIRFFRKVNSAFTSHRRVCQFASPCHGEALLNYGDSLLNALIPLPLRQHGCRESGHIAAAAIGRSRCAWS